MVIGQAIARQARPQKLRVAFAVFLLLVGVFTLAKTVTAPAAVTAHSGDAPAAPALPPVAQNRS
jgi:uncharacterized membrane protein YfcA